MLHAFFPYIPIQCHIHTVGSVNRQLAIHMYIVDVDAEKISPPRFIWFNSTSASYHVVIYVWYWYDMLCYTEPPFGVWWVGGWGWMAMWFVVILWNGISLYTISYTYIHIRFANCLNLNFCMILRSNEQNKKIRKKIMEIRQRR